MSDVDRKKELLEKRQKLARLKQQRNERFNNQGTTIITEAAHRIDPESYRKVDNYAKILAEEKDRATRPGSLSSLEDFDISDKVKVEKGKNSTPTYPTHPFTNRFLPEFSSFQEDSINVGARTLVFREFEIQTDESSFDTKPPSEEEIREKVLKEHEIKKAALEAERLKIETEKKIKKELSEEDKKELITSPKFAKFVSHSAELVENTLNEHYDFMIDYKVVKEVESNEESRKLIKCECSFFDDRWSKNRSVTDVNWSSKDPERVVASFNKNPLAINEPDGIVLVWNLLRPEKPEFVLHSQSDVLTTTFSDFRSELVIGGTYSGHIMLWDMRAKSSPVHKTSFSVNGHTHPIYSMQIVGTQNEHNLITASTDGLVCSWQLDMLVQPVDRLELIHSEHSKTDEVSVTAFGFPDNENDTTAFWVGTEEGNIYQVNRYGRPGGKAGINQCDFYKGHWGPVTGLHFHPKIGSEDFEFNDLFLTSSVDWTSFLNTPTSPRIITPLHSFEGADDYVYDVKWSPRHPAQFASVDGTGKFSVWNLNVDIEALNKIQWDKEGKKTVIGSSDGHVYIYDIGELCIPHDDEIALMKNTISELKGVNIMDNLDSYSGRFTFTK
ncbi:5046_t:CDS:10 [Scutellospora calospora]|uniref:5046_t:CDS:1 n=1 Tax=Scutellospora calospora TaxID=85575 RepID=A0ACA9K630_9GLOM|nr:5046_t:CDS:10 [Scutellospora calospora]